MQSRTAILLLEDGTVFEGVSQGSARTSTGEICFNTGMTGYQEIFTDPSYFGQIMVTSTAHIGNYGTQSEEIESGSVKIAGLVCKNFSKIHSRVREARTLESYLEEEQIPSISNVDTRKLVRHIRENGAMNAIISTDGKSLEELQSLLAKVPSMKGRELASSVSTKEKYEQGSKSSPRRVAVIDLGLKTNTLRNLLSRDTFVTVFPYDVSFEELTAWQPDGIVVSNGPGDPEPLVGVTKVVKSIIDANIPVMGICLGHQIISLSQGLSTYKMHNGHRGINHPVLNTISNKSEITSQNHGFAVSRESCQANPDIEISHVHLNDNTVAGIRIKNKPVVSVQYHPEAGPGPEDSNYLFDEFFRHMEEYQKKNANRVGVEGAHAYESDIVRAAAFLNKGEVIAIPTETAYGLAGNAFDKKTLKKIMKLKGEAAPDDLVLHIKSVAELDTVARDIPEAAIKLAKKFWPGPLTLVLKKKPGLPDLLTGENATVAVRIPGHPVALELLEAIPFPLVAPTANPKGLMAPTSEQQVAEQLKDAIPMILEGGSCEKGIEATIVSFENGRPLLLREGAITKAQLEAVTGSALLGKLL
jgi:carbamoyl-phosphate synthase small subunit